MERSAGGRRPGAGMRVAGLRSGRPQRVRGRGAPVPASSGSSGDRRGCRRAGTDPARGSGDRCGCMRAGPTRLGDAASGDRRGSGCSALPRQAARSAGRREPRATARASAAAGWRWVTGAACLRANQETDATTRRRWNSLGKFFQLHPFCSRQIRLFD